MNLIGIHFAHVSYQPEESISIQHAIGADIIMQLDDVGVFITVFDTFGSLRLYILHSIKSHSRTSRG